MNIKYVPNNDIAYMGFKNCFALFTFVGMAYE